ncbi:MAG TPA: thioredoxin domain-containing protein, partial [Solirubrobacterales bacterium]|nr:thioredoxin domain-containing protein [Solirubrobacterales bacterium]
QMVMEAVVHAFETQREEIRERAPATRARLAAIGEVEPRSDLPGKAALEEAVQRLLAVADREHGGFGGAPKFPPASSLELLLARDEPEVVKETLDAMLAGGIYDQLGGGFARYSVDAIWLVPHFEKMLYDNALLARAYLHGWQRLGHQRYRRICEETLDWMLREMRGPEGGFYSALDADSEGEEGKFYVWTPTQLREALANNPNCIKFPASWTGNLMQFWGVTEEGSFEGANVLHLAGGAEAPEPEGLAEARRALLEARAQRVWPGLDDKRLASWNALAIAALADAGAVLGRDDYLDAARAGAEFVLGEMRGPDGNLLRTFKDGRAHLNAYLEDHAFLLEALLTLYEASFEARWFTEAQALADLTIERFGDPERGGFYSTSADHEELIARRKEVGDHPIPSGNSSAAMGMLRLAALTGERRYEEAAEGVFGLFGKPAVEHPDAFAHMLRALDFHLSPSREVALVGNGLSELAAVVREDVRPHLVLAGGPEGSEQPPLLTGRTSVDEKPAAYVCENFTCHLPVTDPATLRGELSRP